MGTTLVIAREDTLVVYEQVNGLFSEVASIILAHKLNDDAVVQMVTALSQVVNKGQKPPKADPIEKIQKPKAKKKAKRIRHNPNDYMIKSSRLLLMALAPYEFPCTVPQAYKLLGVEDYTQGSFNGLTTRAYTHGLLTRRLETEKERKARGGFGRSQNVYSLTELGAQKLADVRREAILGIEPTPMVDPEFQKLLDEEEAIERDVDRDLRTSDALHMT